MSELQALLDRVEAATGPDRELDAACQHLLLDGEHIHWGCGGLTNGFTVSIDAALALKCRLLPGQAAAVGDMAFDPLRQPWACIWTKGGSADFHGDGATPPLAILAALLKALFDQPQPDSTGG